MTSTTRLYHLLFGAALLLATPVLAGQPAAAQRIVSLSPALTKQLYLLELAPSVVGITSYCPHPGNARPIERIGSVVDPSLERILQLKPDLVISTPLASRKRMASLEALGIKVVEFPPALSFAHIGEQFLQLGELAGKSELALRIMREAREQTQALSAAAGDRQPKPRVFIQIGVKPLATAGPDSFLNDLIVMAGGVNVVEDSTFRVYSREAVLAANPDCILIVTMGMGGEDEIAQWKRYSTLTAAAENRIFMIDAELVCSPTPLDFVKALREVSTMLYPATATPAMEKP
jgi:iron complex transport system substrate-binding protein